MAKLRQLHIADKSYIENARRHNNKRVAGRIPEYKNTPWQIVEKVVECCNVRYKRHGWLEIEIIGDQKIGVKAYIHNGHIKYWSCFYFLNCPNKEYTIIAMKLFELLIFNGNI